MLAVLSAHVVLHWKWIVCVVQGKPSQASGARLTLGVAALASVALLSALPLLAPTTSTPRGALNAAKSPAANRKTLPEVRGSVTIVEAARVYGTTADALIAKLGLPHDTPSYARIGPLLRAHGRRMSDLYKLRDEPAPSPE